MPKRTSLQRIVFPRGITKLPQAFSVSKRSRINKMSDVGIMKLIKNPKTDMITRSIAVDFLQGRGLQESKKAKIKERRL